MVLCRSAGICPNLRIAVRLLLTIGTSVVSWERSFSKLRLLKNYLCATTGQERLNGFALLSIEKRVADQSDFKKSQKSLWAWKCDVWMFECSCVDIAYDSMLLYIEIAWDNYFVLYYLILEFLCRLFWHFGTVLNLYILFRYINTYIVCTIAHCTIVHIVQLCTVDRYNHEIDII